MLRILMFTWLLLPLFGTSPLAAQAVEQAGDKPLYTPSLIQTGEEALAGIMIASLSGIPFTAVVDVENQLPSSSGAVRIQRLKGKIARDSQGRTRVVVDVNILGTPRNPTQVTIHIYDAPRKADIVMFPAVKQAIVNFEEEPERVVHHPHSRRKQIPPLQISPAPYGTIRPVEPLQVERENLGGDILDGATLRHGRETTHVPASFTRDHKPGTVVMDYWYRQELQSFVRIIRHGPGESVQTIVLRDIRRGDPPAALFRIPKAYHVELFYPEDSLIVGYCPLP